MRDITSERLLWFKGGVFAALGVTSGLLLASEARTVRAGVLWALSAKPCSLRASGGFHRLPQPA